LEAVPLAKCQISYEISDRRLVRAMCSADSCRLYNL
jgi:hypothetical protein